MKHKEESPWTVARTVGHLLEIRVYRYESVEDVKRFGDAVIKLAQATPEAICIVDLRTPTIFSQPIASAVIAMMTRTTRVRRKIGLLLAPEHAVFSMQLARLVRQAGDPNRQTFTDPEEMLGWLAEDLTEMEKKRAKAFVGAHKGLSTAS